MRKVIILLFMVLSATMIYAQSKTLKGKVTDNKGTPLVGVTITVKNKPALKVISNEAGLYEVNLPDPANDVLVFSYVGFLSQEIKVNNQASINVKLKTNLSQLDDVIVVSALGINRTQKSLTYASQNVDPKSMTEARDVSWLNTLAGKVAGLQITGTGQPGGSVRMTLRGDNSLSGNNQPLIVVDGIPIENSPGDAGGNMDYGNAAANINPDDIESITVLKGPNGAALYGAKAANGAILITLKKGKPGGDGALGIDVNQSLQMYKITTFPEYQNVYGEGTNLRLVGGNANNINQATGAVNMGTNNQSWGAPMLGQPYNTYGAVPIPGGFMPQSDNVKDLYQTGITSTTNLSLSKSDANSAFRLSYGYTKGNDVIDNLNLIKKHTLNLSASRNLGKLIRIETRLSYTNWNTKNRMLKNLDNSNPLATYVYMARSTRLDGFLPYADANGNSIATGQVNNTENPYWAIYANSNEDTRSALNGGIMATINVSPALKIRGQIVADLATTENYIYKELGGRTLPLGSYSNSLTRQNNMTYEVLAMYTKKLTSNFSVDGLAGFSIADVNVLGRAASISSLLVHNMPSIGNANAVPVATEFLTRSRQQSAFAKAGVGYKEFLFLEVSGRKEWSSTLPLNNNSFFYPGVGANIIFTQFIKNKEIINSGKLRVNYAKVGNSTNPYQLLNTYAPQGLYMGSPYLAYTTQLKNADLKPEQQVSKEIGLDLSLLRNRLNISATYYKNSTINQIVNVQTAYETGFNTRVVNAGEIQNKGFELSAAATVIQTKKFLWRSSINFATNKNQVVSLLPNVNRISLGGRLGTMTVNAIVGQPYGIQMGTRPYLVGDTILVAANGRNIPEANVITGNPRPKWTGGFTNSLSYKGFSLQVTATVKMGGVIFSESYGRAMFQGTTVKSLEGRDDYFFSDFVLGENANERRNLGVIIGTTTTRYLDSNRVKGLAYPNAYLVKTNAAGAPLVDKDGRFMVGDKFLGWIFPQGIIGNDKVSNDVPYLTFDATSVRISEIVLGYTVPKKVFGKSFVKGAYVAVTARNVWQIYQKTPKGIDPEAAAGTTNGTMGIESGGSFPFATLGINVKLNF